MSTPNHPGIHYPAPVRAVPDYQESDAWEGESWRARERWVPSGMLEWFAVSQTLIPALLYLPGNQSIRFVLRASAFLVSLGMWMVWWFVRRRSFPARHPAAPWLILALATVLLELAHPDTPNLTAGIAQVALYASVLSPLFWVKGFAVDRRTLIRVLVILLVCNGVNSIVGVLQVYDPDTWMPTEFSVMLRRNALQLASLAYTGPDGRLLLRPPGLFDSPGAVAGAGTVAALFGLVFFLEPVRWWQRLGALAFSGAGMAAIYLSHVRSAAVVVVGMLVTYAGLLWMQDQKKRLVAFATLSGSVVVAAFLLATVLGGTSVQERFQTFFETDPRTLYYESRGIQVEDALTTMLNNYPLGAGLARWGVMSIYFSVPVSQRIWAEIQLPAWILDGGIFLLLAYTLALLATLLFALKLVRELPEPEDRRWAAAIGAANIGMMAFTLTYVPFASQLGIQFWFLEGLLFAAMATKLRQ